MKLTRRNPDMDGIMMSLSEDELRVLVRAIGSHLEWLNKRKLDEDRQTAVDLRGRAEKAIKDTRAMSRLTNQARKITPDDTSHPEEP